MTLKTLHLSDAGRTVAYRDHGAGEPLVLIHGVGMQSAAWGPQMAALAEHCRVLALDLPGHGDSDPLPRGSELPQFVAWCQATIQALGLGAVNLAGHSMGALIAGGVAIRHPHLIRRVALLNGVHRRDPAARAAVDARAAEISAGNLDLQTPLERWFGNTPAETSARAQVAKWLSAVDQEGYAIAYGAFAHGDSTYADQLSRITCPFLAMTGDGDPNSTPDMSRVMARQVHNGTAVIIQGHRHLINLTKASEVNAHLLHWLEQPIVQEHLS